MLQSQFLAVKQEHGVLGTSSPEVLASLSRCSLLFVDEIAADWMAAAANNDAIEGFQVDGQKIH